MYAIFHLLSYDVEADTMSLYFLSGLTDPIRGERLEDKSLLKSILHVIVGGWLPQAHRSCVDSALFGALLAPAHKLALGTTAALLGKKTIKGSIKHDKVQKEKGSKLGEIDLHRPRKGRQRR